MINIKEIARLVQEKFISMQRHPEWNFRIFNYTAKAQYEKVWTPETLACRGLILDAKDTIVARPFKKFFNLEEHAEPLPASGFKVTEKMDGSLGILYWGEDGNPYLATRGSFVSDQAAVGNRLLQAFWRQKECFDRRYTYLFEIIYPENRIVIDYGNESKLVFLAAVDIATGIDIDHASLPDGIERVKHYDGITEIGAIRGHTRENAEGYVIRFDTGLRLKVKFDEYVRLHRILTGTNTRNIWDALRAGTDLSDVIDRVPDEFYAWVTQTVKDLRTQFHAVEAQAQQALQQHDYVGITRKDAALHILKHYKSLSSIIFLMLDGRNYKDDIWKIIRPEATRPFKTED